MSDPLTTLATLTNLIASLGNVQNVSVLKQRLALVVDQLALVNKEMIKCREENGRLAAELSETKKKLAAQIKTHQYTHYRGACFKRDFSGRYESVVFCPRCHNSASSWPPGEGQFCCEPCKWFSEFTAHDLPRILLEIGRKS